MKNIKKILLFTCLGLSTYACRDLDVRPESSIIMPETVADFEQLLEHAAVTTTPALPHIASDEYFFPDYETWQSLLSNVQRNAYVWKSDIYAGELNVRDWDDCYKGIFHCNTVLDHLHVLEDDGQRKRIEGWALFARAYLFHSLALTFAGVYDAATADEMVGIPIRTSAGVDEIMPPSTLADTYRQIIQDATAAIERLPNERPLDDERNRPSKAAGYALLARTYLNMGDYPQAEAFSDKALAAYDVLVDYNSLDTAARSAFTYNSEETIYFSRMVYGYIAYGQLTLYGVDTALLALYPESDLRPSVYFLKNTIGNYTIKPINTLTGLPFTGLATDEIYLIKAECLARRGNTSDALEYLNRLVKTRVKVGTFSPIYAETSEAALDLILLERRKALVWRCIRWSDLKRLNRDGYGITLRRVLNGTEYALPPNDPRYTFPFPEQGL